MTVAQLIADLQRYPLETPVNSTITTAYQPDGSCEITWRIVLPAAVPAEKKGSA